jgi:hypothetical protein
MLASGVDVNDVAVAIRRDGSIYAHTHAAGARVGLGADVRVVARGSIGLDLMRAASGGITNVIRAAVVIVAIGVRRALTHGNLDIVRRVAGVV